MAGIIFCSGFESIPLLAKSRLNKRLDRIERLRLELGADVYYPLANTRAITVRFDDKEYESESLRQIEALLRYFKRTSRPA